jgi:hypothetical protein
MNTKPIFVEKLNIPIKPPLPIKDYFNREIFREEHGEIFKLFEKCKKNKHMSYLYSVDELNKYKEDYKNKYIKDYENNFNKHYEEYRKQYYIDIIKQYCNKNVYVTKVNENQYKIETNVCDYYYEICCELKPLLSDDYPCVLRKLKAQITLTNNDIIKNTTPGYRKISSIYTLIIGNFTSTNVSKEQLIEIFNQSNIKIIFTNQFFETREHAISYKKKDILFESKLIEENKIQVLTDSLLETQQSLLHVEEKNKQLEEKIKQLEEEILSLKTQKQNKSIKDYFVKK